MTDTPDTSDTENRMPRREFLKKFGLGAGGLIVAASPLGKLAQGQEITPAVDTQPVYDLFAEANNMVNQGGVSLLEPRSGDSDPIKARAFRVYQNIEKAYANYNRARTGSAESSLRGKFIDSIKAISEITTPIRRGIFVDPVAQSEAQEAQIEVTGKLLYESARKGAEGGEMLVNVAAYSPVGRNMRFKINEHGDTISLEKLLEDGFSIPSATPNANKEYGVAQWDTDQRELVKKSISDEMKLASGKQLFASWQRD